MADDTVQTYETLDLEGNRELIVAAGSNTMPEQDWSRNGDNYKRASITALAVTENNAHIKASFRDAMADQAGEATIERHGKIYNVPRKGATAASAPNAGKIRGVAASTWLTADVLIHKSGLRFRPTDAGAVGVSGEAVVGIIALDVGSQTRLSAGEVLTWEAGAPAGLELEVELVADLNEGGLDREEIGAYRTRILNRIAQPRKGGSLNDWRECAKESSDEIADGYPYPHRNGLGSMDIAALKAGTGSARLLDAGERADLLAYLETVRPAGVRGIRVLEVVAELLDVETIVEPQDEPQWAPDWTPQAAIAVLTWTPATRVLVFSVNRPPSMAVGDRLVVGGAGSLGLQVEIEALSGANAVVLADALGQSFAVAAPVYSGGPLVAVVRPAIVTLINSLGPRVGTYGRGWTSALRINELRKVVQNTAGVFDHTNATPIVNTEPTASVYPDDEWVSLLVPDQILVRYL